MTLINRSLTIVALCVGLALLSGILSEIKEAQAATGDAAGIFTVTVTQVETSKDGGSTYTTLFSGSKSINIASADAGAVAGSLASGATLSAGTYDRMRVTIGSTLQIKGFVNNGATTFYTNNDADGFDLNPNAANTPGADYTTSTLTIPAANRVDIQTVSIVVPAEGSAPTVRVNFDTTGVLSVSNNQPRLNAPVVTVTQS